MDALAESIRRADMSNLEEVPDEDKASLLPAAGTSEAMTEPKWEKAEVDRERKKPIPCLIPLRKSRDGQEVPCRDKTFTYWAGLKKHHKDYHDPKTWPEWKKGRPIFREREGGPNIYDQYEEDSGPMVACRCISFLWF